MQVTVRLVEMCRGESLRMCVVFCHVKDAVSRHSFSFRGATGGRTSLAGDVIRPKVPKSNESQGPSWQ